MRIRIVIAVCLTCLTACDRDRDGTETRRVIILTIDGPRFSETWGDSMGKYIPYLANDLAPQGAFVPEFYNDGPTETTAGHTALTTGVYQSINNSGQEFPQHPSIFQLWRARSGADSTAAWIITSKDKLEVLSNCLDTAWVNRERPMRDCGIAGLGSGSRDDSLTLIRARDVMDAYQPTLMLVHFKEPDVTGHTGDWSGYLKQITRTDRLANDLWNFIQSHPVYSQQTTLFIALDHGRHLDGISSGFSGHGDDCAGCRKIACLVLGPDTGTGVTIPTRYNQTNLAATVAELLGFTIPHSDASTMNAIFKNPI